MEDSSAEKIGEATMAEVRRASDNAAGETDRRPTRAALRKLKKGRAPNPTGTPADTCCGRLRRFCRRQKKQEQNSQVAFSLMRWKYRQRSGKLLLVPGSAKPFFCRIVLSFAPL
jgi:hypothetical protein